MQCGRADPVLGGVYRGCYHGRDLGGSERGILVRSAALHAVACLYGTGVAVPCLLAMSGLRTVRVVRGVQRRQTASAYE